MQLITNLLSTVKSINDIKEMILSKLENVSIIGTDEKRVDKLFNLMSRVEKLETGKTFHKEKKESLINKCIKILKERFFKSLSIETLYKLIVDRAIKFYNAIISRYNWEVGYEAKDSICNGEAVKIPCRKPTESNRYIKGVFISRQDI